MTNQLQLSKFLLTILVGLFLIFWYQSAIASEYFSGDTLVNTANNKTKPIRELKILDEVSVDQGLALQKSEPASNNLKIDATWQIATFNASGDIITFVKPEKEFIEKSISSQNKNEIFSKDKIFKLVAIPLSTENFTLISLQQVENDKDAKSNTEFVTAIIEYQNQLLIRYSFVNNENIEFTLTCSEAIKVYDENQQKFIPIDQLAEPKQSFQQNNQVFTFKSKEDAGSTKAYMIEVNHKHHFYANGILVHNPTPEEEAEAQEHLQKKYEEEAQRRREAEAEIRKQQQEEDAKIAAIKEAEEQRQREQALREWEKIKAQIEKDRQEDEARKIAEAQQREKEELEMREYARRKWEEAEEEKRQEQIRKAEKDREEAERIEQERQRKWEEEEAERAAAREAAEKAKEEAIIEQLYLHAGVDRKK